MVDRQWNHKEVALLQSAVENTNDAFVTIDENHRVFLFNKAAECLFGYSRTEVIGHDLNTIMAPSCSRDHRKAVERYVLTRRAQRIGSHTEIVARRKNGDTFPADISFSVSEVDGRLYFTAILRDLTETKALQEQVARAERLTALGQVVAEITHEIKNPLMLIGGFARQLSDSLSDPKAREKAAIISTEVRRLENLLQELREYYLPKTLNREEIDTNTLLEEIHALVKDDCKQNRITVDLRLEKRPVRVEADREKLKQVILNLLTNAIQSMEHGGTLTLESRLAGDEVGITVVDNGCGICAHHKDKIFSTFFTTKKQGTGLGLSISKEIIQQHRGTLTFESEEGQGTAFTIRMPVSRAAELNTTANRTR